MLASAPNRTDEVEPTKTGFVVSRVQQQGENFDWTEMVLTEIRCVHPVGYSLSQTAGPGGPVRIIGFVTPIDETSCCVFFWRSRKVSGLPREAWRFLYRSILEKRHWAVLEQDREMLTAMSDDARKRELFTSTT